VHYRPRTLIMNNLEFDHADIFDDLAMIQRQFHHLVRIVPGNGLIVAPGDDASLGEVLEMGCWTPIETIGPDGLWQVESVEADGSHYRVLQDGKPVGEVRWGLTGDHNVRNGLAAIAAARHAGVPVEHCLEALSGFENVKRRMELRGEINGIRLYDDFAHHPTAIETTLAGLRRQVGEERIIAVLEPRSNTMRMGIHKESLPASLASADRVIIFSPASLDWDAEAVFASLGDKATVYDSTEAIVDTLRMEARPGDQLLVMSNGGFENIHQRILEALRP
jgi:UDP-N-acetylmuramate: L-alanyl-gamma-D-glutamyl-meso-diaminopimelate ligase